MATLTSRSASRQTRKSGTWKDIDQSVKPKAMSSAAEKRVWMRRAKLFGMGIAAVGVVVALLQLSSVWDRAPELLSKAGESLPLKHVEIDTDGALPQDWVLSYMELDADSNLLGLDLAALKAKLESIGQVKAAHVERRFPDTLRISLVEREPVMRLLAQRSNGDRLLLYVDGEGHVFEGDALDPRLARSLPFLDGVVLRRSGEGFLPLQGVDSAAKLLTQARSIAPHLYRNWRVVSLAKPGEIRVRTRQEAEIVFGAENDYHRSLARLDYIVDHFRRDISSNMAQVDLTLGSQVPVKSARAAR